MFMENMNQLCCLLYIDTLRDYKVNWWHFESKSGILVCRQAYWSADRHLGLQTNRHFFITEKSIIYPPSGKEPPPPLPEKKVSAPPPPEKKPTTQSTPAVSEPHEGVPQTIITPPHPAMPMFSKKTVPRGKLTGEI